jgi:hypothetical protein
MKNNKVIKKITTKDINELKDKILSCLTDKNPGKLYAAGTLQNDDEWFGALVMTNYAFYKIEKILDEFFKK